MIQSHLSLFHFNKTSTRGHTRKSRNKTQPNRKKMYHHNDIFIISLYQGQNGWFVCMSQFYHIIKFYLLFLYSALSNKPLAGVLM